MPREINCGYFLSEYVPLPVFLLLTTGLLLLFNYWFFRSGSYRRNINILALVLINTGGVVNLSERLLTGCVTDYIPFLNLLYFNVWDILIILGILILGGDTFYEQKRSTN